MTSDIEEHLIQAQKGVRELKKKVNTLQRENSQLRSASASKNDKELISHYTTDDDTNLEDLNLRESKKEGRLKISMESRLKKKIEHLQKRLLQEEVADLQTEKVTDEEIDPFYRMRKLLRRFSKLMLVSTISGDECPVCDERLRVNECSALLCGHLICRACAPSISRAATRDTEELRCPKCKKDTPREDLELVHMTETDRWDELLKVAQAWMAFDRPAELETSEEEDEENFITDGYRTSEATSENNDDQTVTTSPDVDQEEREVSSPASAAGVLFSDSPTKVKRKRMEELAAQRSQRRRAGNTT